MSAPPLLPQIIHLPLELLIEIFYLATYNPTRNLDSLVLSAPFESIYANDEKAQFSEALQTKYSLALVCSLFRKLSLQFMYEDIWIRHGSCGLLESLKNSKVGSQEGLGKFVRRVSLSAVWFAVAGLRYGSIIRNARHILLHCPNIRIISQLQENVIQDKDSIEDGIPSIDDLQFPLLQRVDWKNPLYSYSPSDDGPSPFPPYSPRFIWTCTTLRVLHVGAGNFPVPWDTQATAPQVSLPNVHTLGISSLSAFGVGLPHFPIALPALRRLVVSRPEALHNLFDGGLLPFGAQITHLEIGAAAEFLRQDFVASLLGYCPNTTDLYIPISSTLPTRPNRVPEQRVAYAVERVYLHAGHTATEPGAGFTYGTSESAWRVLSFSHIASLCGETTRFSRLQKITLCGTMWKEIVVDEQFEWPLHMTRVRGIELVSDDTEVQSLLLPLLHPAADGIELTR
ncbi:hypothetical protein EW145_g1877 [Phellinidium pouzarii]|uniref:F-box domain-containing protein n=1 Tax=Phellinidium pouzarii TaxID=167371 RepID=A0A4S4LIF4_9AGAM|nr:hypothetical protein EW145_g1877 [Phellinidium pouzarii]